MGIPQKGEILSNHAGPATLSIFACRNGIARAGPAVAVREDRGFRGGMRPIRAGVSTLLGDEEHQAEKDEPQPQVVTALDS